MSVNIPSLVFRYWKRLLLGVAGFILAYALLGFWLLPAILKREIPKRLGTLLHREVSIERVRLNPFALSVTLEGFRIKDLDGGDFFSWKSLYVNAQLSSLFTDTLTFKAIEWVEPGGRVVVAKDGRLNFSDILDSFAASPAEKNAPKPVKKDAGKELAIGHLAVRGLKVELIDRSPKEPFATVVGPVGFQVDDFRTEKDSSSPYSFAGVTEAGERFEWKGEFSSEPLQSTGELSLRALSLPKYHPYYRDQVAFDLRGGKLDFKAGYLFQWFNSRHVLKLRQGGLSLTGLQIHQPGKATPELTIPTVEASGMEMDVLGNAMSIDALKIKGVDTSFARGKDGKFNLVELFTPKPSPEKKPEGKPFKFRLRELACVNWKIAYRDDLPARPVQSGLQVDKLILRDFSLDPACQMALLLESKVDGKQPLRAEGSLKPFDTSLDLKLKLENFEVPPFDPYMEPGLALRVPKGRISGEGRFRGQWQGKKSDYIRYEGLAELAQFEAMDAAQQEPFLRYKQLRMEGMDYRTNPDELKIKRVELLGPENRLVVSKDGSTNVARALKIVQEKSPDKKAAPASPAASVAPPTQGKPLKVGIGSIKIDKGSLAYIDRSLEPNAALVISDLHGSYTGLSTEPESRSAVELKGLAGGLAPITIKGRAMPLRHDQDTDIILKIDGAELTDYSPYAMKYLGYVIRKGKLDVNASVKIQKRQLDAKFNTRLNQFYLGDKVKSPDATKMPVKLALAILRDRKGIIDLDLPVEGNLDTPEFRYGKLLWNAVINVLTKVATSPFDLLAKTFGGEGKDLSYASFQPGSDELDAEAAKKLDIIVRSLQERPELTLELEGAFDPAQDAVALKKEILEQKLRQAKAGQKGDEGLSVAPEERDRWLTAVFEAAFPSAPQPKGAKPQPVPPPLEMEQRLLGAISLDINRLRELALRRSRQAIKYLTSEGRVDASRVFEVQPGERSRSGGSKVLFTVK